MRGWGALALALASSGIGVDWLSRAAAQELVRDFNTTPSAEPGSSHPQQFVPLPNGELLLVLTTPRTGSELWRTNGTAAGTQLVADLQPGPTGSGIAQFTEISTGTYLFTASTADEGWELWRTNGTSAGTQLVADIWPGPSGSTATHLVRVGNRIYFLANDGQRGTELWSSDGTRAGTSLLTEVVPGPDGMSNGTAGLVALGSGELIFSALVAGSWELWRSDGSAAGTRRILGIAGLPAFGPSRLRSFGNRVLFNARGTSGSDELWVSDGTSAGTFSLGVAGPFGIQIAGGLAFFASYETATGNELWVTDGTLAGTRLILDLLPGGGFFGSDLPWLVGDRNGEVYFFASSPAGRLLFRTNGTATGTFAVAPIANLGSYYGDNWGVRIGNELWFRIFSGPSSHGLYRTDGTLAGTQLVTSLETGALAPIGSSVLLSGDDGTRVGVELYLTDGTPASTRLLLDLVPAPVSMGSYPEPRASFQGRAIVLAEEAATGRELWLSDGTPAGTRLIADLAPGSRSFELAGLAVNASKILILGASGVSDEDPYVSDGTRAGTYQLNLFPASSGFRAMSPAAFGERFVFSGSLPSTGYEPWLTDGTLTGTIPLGDLAAGSRSSSPDGWFELGDRVLFRALNVQGELWLFATDGTAVGTSPLARLDDGGSSRPTWAPVIFEDRVWFAASTPSQGVELWSTDGTPAGTSLAFDLEPGPQSSSPGLLAVAGAHLVVQATLGGAPRFVSISGAPLRATTLGLTANEMTGPHAIDERRVALITRTGSSGPVQLWGCDGTNAGTTFAANIDVPYPYLVSARPGAARLFFAAFHPAFGYELWSTAGTPGSTVPVTSFDFGRSLPGNVVRAGERLLFRADDGIHGQELFSLRYAATNDHVAELFGSGCAGTAGVVPRLALRGQPRLSASAPFHLDLALAAPLAPAMLLWSQERTPLALPGCTLWVGAPLGSVAALTDPSGALSIPIPVVPDIVGELFAVQGFVLDPGGVAFGAASATRGLELVIGR